MEKLVDNKVIFFECRRVMLPDKVFFDRLVERFDTCVLVRPILAVISYIIQYTFNLLTNLLKLYCEPPSLLAVRPEEEE